MDLDYEVDPATRRALFERVRRHTGIAMNERKWTMLQGRLRRRVRTLGLVGFDDYLRVLDGNPDEAREFIDLVTTNETSFFRTPRIWDYFAREFLPTWFATHPGATLRIWSAASSSGEEAWSTAMLCEEFRAQHPAFRYAIVGTDISLGILAAASAARYDGRSMEGLRQHHPQMLEKYFHDEGRAIRVREALRPHVTFRRHNLYDAPRDLGPVDLALLRNVLIYFDEAGQSAVLAQMRRALRPGGVLIVGESESLSRLASGFAFEQPLIYRNGEHDDERRP